MSTSKTKVRKFVFFSFGLLLVLGFAVCKEKDKGTSDFTLTFNVNGGSPIPPFTAAPGTEVDLTSGEYDTSHPDGKYFGGWYPTSDFSDLAAQITSVTLTADMEIYAKWNDRPTRKVTLNSVSVNRDGEERVNKERDLLIEDSVSVDLLGIISDYEHGVFLGWFEEEALSTQITGPVLVTVDRAFYTKKIAPWAGVLDFTWYDEEDWFEKDAAGEFVLVLDNKTQVYSRVIKASHPTEYHLSTPEQWAALAWVCSEHNGIMLKQPKKDSDGNPLYDGEGNIILEDVTYTSDLTDYEKYTGGNVKGVKGKLPGAQNTFEGVKFYLDNDIDMGGVYDPDGVSGLYGPEAPEYDPEDGKWSGPNYYPVGSQGSGDPGAETDDGIHLPHGNFYGLFYGSFDGQGHIVKNICLKRVSSYNAAGGSGQGTGDYSQSCGLFGRVGAIDAVVFTPDKLPKYDIVIQNVAVTGYIRGYRSTAGIVGKTLHVAFDKNITVKNCLNFATVSTRGGKKGTGGIVGALWNFEQYGGSGASHGSNYNLEDCGARVMNCANFGTITAKVQNANVAGISGAAEGPTLNSYNVGRVENLEKRMESNAAAVTLVQTSKLTVSNCYGLKGSSPGYGDSTGKSVLNDEEGNTGYLKNIYGYASPPVPWTLWADDGAESRTHCWKEEREMKSVPFADVLSGGDGTNTGTGNWVFPDSESAIYKLMKKKGFEGYPVPKVFNGDTNPMKCIITFDANGGTGTISPLVVDEGAVCTLPASGFTRDGYVFIGWSVKPKASSPAYEGGWSYTAVGFTSFYVVWGKWKVTFDANGGGGTMAPMYITENGGRNLTPNAFTRSGYVFIGWSKDANAASSTYPDQHTDFNTSADVTLYAVWQQE